MPYSSLIRERRIGFIAEVFRNVQIGPDAAMSEGELVQDLPRTNRECPRVNYFSEAVDGSMFLPISVILLAGKPLSSAWRWISASSLAR